MKHIRLNKQFRYLRLSPSLVSSICHLGIYCILHLKHEQYHPPPIPPSSVGLSISCMLEKSTSVPGSYKRYWHGAWHSYTSHMGLSGSYTFVFSLRQTLIMPPSGGEDVAGPVSAGKYTIRSVEAQTTLLKVQRVSHNY